MDSVDVEGDRNRRKRRPSVMMLAAMTGLTALSIDMSLPAMPELQRLFSASVGTVQLTLSLFLVGFAAGQLVCGPASDRLGRRPVLLMGLILFALAGLACAAAPTLGVLIACRFVQGLGASVGPILARAIVRDTFGERDAVGVLSQMTQVMIVAPLLAPTLGGFLLGTVGWQAIFLTLGVAGTVLLVLCWRTLPETLRRQAMEADGAPGLAQSFRAVLTHRESVRHVLTVCFSYAGMFAYISGSPFVFIDGFGVPRQVFGILFAATAGSLLVGATLNRILLRRLSSPVLLRRGVFAVFGAGLLVAAGAWAGVGGPAAVLVPMMAYMVGMGILQPNATAAAMAPHARQAGVTSSVIGSLQTAGGALAGYVVGALYDHTPRSLGATVAVMAIATLLIHAPGRPRREEARAQASEPPLAAEV